MSKGETDMTHQEIEIGKVFYFGYRNTPNTVTRVTPLKMMFSTSQGLNFKAPAAASSSLT